MRIFDRIASGESVHHYDGTVVPEIDFGWRKAAHTATRIIADESADHYWRSPQNTWTFEDNDFGPLRAPFPKMWIEWALPRTSLIEGQWSRTEGIRYAVYIEESVNPDGSWKLSCYGLVSQDSIEVRVLPALPVITVEADAVTARNDLAYDKDMVGHMLAGSHEFPVEELAAGISAQMNPAFLAIGWMNCKNVSLVDESVPERVRRKRERRGQIGGLDYHRIVITDSAARTGQANRDAETRGQRLHMVRGHFAHYTAEKPLFGRVVGTFWRSWHVRGDESLGRINHEYHVMDRSAS